MDRPNGLSVLWFDSEGVLLDAELGHTFVVDQKIDENEYDITGDYGFKGHERVGQITQ